MTEDQLPLWAPEPLRITAEELEEAQEIRNALVSLLEHRGWKYLQNMAQKDVLEPGMKKLLARVPSSMDEIISEQYVKGHLGGVQFILAQPDELIEQATSVIDTYNALNEDEEEQ